MIDTLANLTALSPLQIAAFAGIVFIAAIVRGFSGFALSALIMAALASILPPVEILPMNFLLEAVASILLVRGGVREADMRIVIGLVVTSAIGMPLGLYLTTSVPVDITRMTALSIILVLSVLLFANVQPKNGDNNVYLFGAGFLSGLVTGVAGVGGMVVVIYVFSLGRKAQVIRASLVMYLFLSLAIFLFYSVFFGLMDQVAMARGAIFAIPLVPGILIGARLFSNAHEKYYRTFCLGLLILLAITGLLRIIL